MPTTQSENPKSRELVTEILDKPQFWSALKTTVSFLRAKNIGEVRVHFGFVLDRDLKGIPQGSDQTIALGELESFIERGLIEGTIEWGRSSDFHFYPVGAELDLILCNDHDLHLTSADSALVLGLGHAIRASGIKVYGAGNLI